MSHPQAARAGADPSAARAPAPTPSPARAAVRPLVAALAALLGGCASVSLPSLDSLKRLEIPDNDPSFRTRLYAGAAFGNSRLDPNTAGTAFSVEDPSTLGTQLKLGVDVHNTLAFEIETGVLGEAKLREAGTEVNYTSASISALVYGFGGVQMRSRREGWSAFGRLGYGSLSKSSQVVPLEEDVAGAVLGIGGEYGFDNGLGIRGELTRYDSDAFFAGLGAIWRFGTPREFGAAFSEVARDALGPVPETRVADGGRALEAPGAPGAIGRSSEPRLGAAGPARGDADRGRTRRVSRNASGSDADGDGVVDARDGCANTTPGTSVDTAGCGLFDAVLGDVAFKPGSWWLNARARGALDDIAERLVAFPEVRVEVIAHTDARGPADLNLALSARRAEAVVDYLRTRGVPELQLESTGVGETRPLASNDSAPGRKRNRRVELVTLADLPREVLAGRAIEGSVWHYPPSARADRALETLAARPGPARPAAPAPAPAPAPVASAAPAASVAEPSLGAALSSAAGTPADPASTARSRPAPLPVPGFLPGFSLAGVVDGLGFASGSASLADGAEAILERVRRELERHPSARIAVMAHTDATGDPEANRALSVERARTVVDRLAALGIEPSRLVAEGYGDSLPLVQAVTETDRARNRRVELRVLR